MPPSSPVNLTKVRKNAEIQYIDICIKFCTPGKSPEKMGISPTAAAQTWHLKIVTSKCPPTSLSSLRVQRALGDPESSFPASDTSRALLMARPQASRRLQEHQELYSGGKKEDEHHALVVPHCLPWGQAVHRSCSPVTTAWGRAEQPSLPCKWLTVLELIHAAGPGHSSVLRSKQLFSPLRSLVWFWFVSGSMAQDRLLLQFKNPSSEQSNVLPRVLCGLKTKQLFEERL